MSDTPTTDRAQRLRAVASGSAETAVDRLSPAADPWGPVRETHLRNGGETDATE